MKLNCGPTQETANRLEQEERARLVAKWMEHGEVVFAWFPIRLGDNDCRWLEKVRRRPVGYVDAWGDVNRLSRSSQEKLKEKLLRNRPVWKYEALSSS